MKKTFDCVELQRQLRRELAQRYPKSKNKALLAHLLKKEFGTRIKPKAQT